jgi:hypothetical protein
MMIIKCSFFCVVVKLLVRDINCQKVGSKAKNYKIIQGDQQKLVSMRTNKSTTLTTKAPEYSRASIKLSSQLVRTKV